MRRVAVITALLVVMVAFVSMSVLLATTTAAAAAVTPSTLATAPDEPSEPADPTEAPVITVNPFFPTERSLSECLSVVPKPGCGSEARGGPYQAAVFGVILAGVGIIATRIVIGVRRNRAANDEPATP